MIPFVIGIGVGVVVDEIFHALDSKPSKKESTKGAYWVFVRSKEFGKSMLTFDGYKSSKMMYDKILENKKVRYKDIVDFDDSEKELYNKWKIEGNIGKPGYPKSLGQTSRISEISFGRNDEEFQSQEF